MWKPAVSGMEEAHICANLNNRRIRRYLVCRLKRPEARDFSHVRFTEEMMILTGEGWGKQSLGYFFQEVHKIGNCFI